ncbi:uncharacterized [Tachysurus ichikawai]
MKTSHMLESRVRINREDQVDQRSGSSSDPVDGLKPRCLCCWITGSCAPCSTFLWLEEEPGRVTGRDLLDLAANKEAKMDWGRPYKETDTPTFVPKCAVSWTEWDQSPHEFLSPADPDTLDLMPSAWRNRARGGTERVDSKCHQVEGQSWRTVQMCGRAQGGKVIYIH